MPTRILGISAYYHDSAACLVEDGRIVAAAQEERFTRKKHDAGFPSHAVDYCLREAGITASELDLVGFYEKPLVKFDRLLETYVACAPRGLRSYLMAMPLWLSEKLWMADDIREQLDGYEGEVLFGEHHESHAASAFYPSPFEQAAIVTIDGVGEWATSSIGVGRGHEIEMLRELRFPHSLGLLYSAFTYFTGFRVNSGEYKVMGLAPYGEPKYVKAIKDHLRRDPRRRQPVDEHGVLHLPARPDDDRAARSSGCSAARRASPRAQLTQREMDLARSIQDITEEVMLKMAAFAHRETGHARPVPGRRRRAELRRQRPHPARRAVRRDLDSAGGRRRRRRARRRAEPLAPLSRASRASARKRRARGSGRRDAAPDRVAAVRRRHERLVSRPALHERRDSRVSSTSNGYPARRVEPAALAERIAALMAEEKVDRPVPGPDGVRAARARRPLDHRRRAVAEDAVGDEPEDQVPRIVPAVRAGGAARARRAMVRARRRQPVHAAGRRRAAVAPAAGAGRRPRRCGASSKLNVPRSTIPAVTHVDYSARIQTVRRETNPLYYDIIEAFYRRTGCPVIVNTSFNVRGEPIVCTPEDAYRCFMRTDMDVLVLENFVLVKSEQAPIAEDESWRKEFVLD